MDGWKITAGHSVSTRCLSSSSELACFGENYCLLTKTKMRFENKTKNAWNFFILEILKSGFHSGRTSCPRCCFNVQLLASKTTRVIRCRSRFSLQMSSVEKGWKVRNKHNKYGVTKDESSDRLQGCLLHTGEYSALWSENKSPHNHLINKPSPRHQITRLVYAVKQLEPLTLQWPAALQRQGHARTHFSNYDIAWKMSLSL